MPPVSDSPALRPNPRVEGLPPLWQSIRRGGFEWLGNSAFCGDWVEETGELPISQWLDEGIATIIKTGPHRAVYRLTLPMGNFFLKHFRTPDWQAVFQNMIRPCKAELEWRAAKRVAALGLETFETVAVGKRRRYGLVTDSFLITREIPVVIPLDEFVLEKFAKLDGIKQRIIRGEISRQLGHIAATLHQGRLLHRDLHPGNVLVQAHGEECQLVLIDLHALSVKRNIPPKAIAHNISLLNNFFGRLTSQTDRMRFLDAYAEVWNRGSSQTFPFDREMVRFVERICKSELTKADRRGDIKWRRGNRRLVILESPPNRCRGLAEVGTTQLQCFKESPERLFAKPALVAWQTRQESLKSAVIELTVDGKPQRAIATAFREPSLARNAWEMGHALLRRRLSARRPLFFVETQSGDWNTLVVEDIPGALPLSERMKKQRHSLSLAEWHVWLNKVSSALAAELRMLDDHGFHQPDLRLGTILIRETAHLTLWFDALESIRQVTRVDSSQINSALATLWRSLPAEVPISSTQALRFLRGYLGLQFSQAWKSHWRGVSVLIRRPIARKVA